MDEIVRLNLSATPTTDTRTIVLLTSGTQHLMTTISPLQSREHIIVHQVDIASG